VGMQKGDPVRGFHQGKAGLVMSLGGDIPRASNVGRRIAAVGME